MGKGKTLEKGHQRSNQCYQVAWVTIMASRKEDKVQVSTWFHDPNAYCVVHSCRLIRPSFVGLHNLEKETNVPMVIILDTHSARKENHEEHFESLGHENGQRKGHETVDNCYYYDFG